MSCFEKLISHVKHTVSEERNELAKYSQSSVFIVRNKYFSHVKIIQHYHGKPACNCLPVRSPFWCRFVFTYLEVLEGSTPVVTSIWESPESSEEQQKIPALLHPETILKISLKNVLGILYLLVSKQLTMDGWIVLCPQSWWFEWSISKGLSKYP